MKPVDRYYQEQQYYFELLNKLMRSGKPCYLYETNLEVLPIRFDCSPVQDQDLYHSLITVRVYCNDVETLRQYRQYKHWIRWEEYNNTYVTYHGPAVGPQQVTQVMKPSHIEAVVPLRYISDTPFDGLPSGRLLYGRED